MRFGLDLPTTDAFADPRLLADLAHEAEESGWDGFFVYDQVATETPERLADPWTCLTAVALRTSRLLFGPLVTPLARRRPWQVARQTATLDHLSGGRLVLGVGLGASPEEWDDLGEETEPKTRAARLDDALTVLTGLWSGQPFSRPGPFYPIRHAHFVPAPLQTPRIPIWVGGTWPIRAPFRRAARWDGVFPHYRGPAGYGMLPAAEVRALLDFIAGLRPVQAGPFDVVVRNKVARPDRGQEGETVAEYAAAGVTWWLEGVEISPTPDALRSRLRQGPPRLQV